MKILSIDTASNLCSISVLENKNLLKENTLDDTKNHSEKVMPLISETLSSLNLELKDIDLIVCDKGPGSFTGIRIGTATVLSFADSLGIKCIGISALESLLYNNEIKTKYACSLINANNNNAYFALYEFNDNCYNLIGDPDCKNINDIIDFCSSQGTSNITFVGDGAEVYKDILLSRFSDCLIGEKNLLSSYSLGLAGFNAFNSGKLTDVLPLYLRKPQAERALEEKK
ncbi:MAG: tRNA (adenosine(37)-N6)-threonylcarbamoyltransferase complex dimerization subunit type 1 TsaB [Clostridia bacterium]|nr:tRNA (adenosine(37)-N6)-threonylcarbamoyltransferase complex dimerization subunit type 1 TsaB [Clostridia bacterium]